MGQREEQLRGKGKCGVRSEKLSGGLLAEGPNAPKALYILGRFMLKVFAGMISPNSVITLR